MSFDYKISPHVGAGGVEFGMSKEQVETILGPPDGTSINHQKQYVEFRSFMNVAYSSKTDGVVVHLGFGRQELGVRYDDLYLFKENGNDVLEYLIKEDGNPYYYLGFVVFLDLGISLTGFHDNDISQKAVSLFPRGAWDNRKKRMKPFILAESDEQ